MSVLACARRFFQTREAPARRERDASAPATQTIFLEQAGNDNWLIGEPCLDSWYGVTCCPAARPKLMGDECCTFDGSYCAALNAASPSNASASSSLDPASRVAIDLPSPPPPTPFSYVNQECVNPNRHLSVQFGSGKEVSAADYAVCVVVRINLTANNLGGALAPPVHLRQSERVDGGGTGGGVAKGGAAGGSSPVAQSPPDNEGRRLTSAGQEYVPNLCSTLPYLQELILSDNSISGGLPGIFADESSCLPQLRALNVESNQLTGALPRWLVERAELGYTAQDSGGDGGLRTLHLGDNLFDDPREEANRQRVTPLLLACNRLDIDCTGLPPNSCTAFGPRYEVAVEGDVCVRCPSEAERMLLALLVGFAMTVLMALALLFARLVRKYRSRVRHMTTALIIVNHVQNLALIGAMRLEWPEVLVEIYAALRLDVLPYLHVECFTRASDANTQQTIAWLASCAGCLLMLLILGAWWPIRSLAKPIQWRDDMIEAYTPVKYDS